MTSMTATRDAKRHGTTAQPEPRRFTVDEYYRMAKVGILGPDERVELLEGEVIRMSPIGSRHNASVLGLTEWFVPRVVGRALVSVQGAVRLSSMSELQPDLMLLRYRSDRYAGALPGPEDVLLLIEVSDTTLRTDRNVKLPLYAQAGIPEVWIFDLRLKRVLVYRQPRGNAYEQMTVIDRTGSLSPAAFPELVLPVAQVLD